MSDLIPEETLALVGELLDEPLTSTISMKESQRFALAAGDLNPIYFDDSAAREAGYAGSWSLRSSWLGRSRRTGRSRSSAKTGSSAHA